MKPMLLSLKPQYAELVFLGLKTAELRRLVPSDVEGRKVYIYVSSPIRMLRGGFVVGKVWQGTPEDVWELVKDVASIDVETYNAYYEGRAKAFALSIVDAWEYERPLPLSELRAKFDRFVVPQSWRYLTGTEANSFRRMKRVAIPESPRQAVA